MKRVVSAWFVVLGATVVALAQNAAAPTPHAASPPSAPKLTLPAMSESKFLAALYAEIARHTPETSPAGEGEVTASFHVDAQGKVDKIVIDKATNSALGDEVKKILAQVQAPPPPNGGDDIGQTFKFHAE